MNFEKIKQGIGLADLEQQGGKNIVAGAFFELYKPFGKKYGFDESKIDANELLEILNEAGITKEEIDALVNAEIGELGADNFKKNTDTSNTFDNRPDLIPLRNKFVKILGGELIEA